MLQFTIRDLLLVTTIVALIVGWTADRQERLDRIDRLESELKDRLVVNDSSYQIVFGRLDGRPIDTDF